MEIKPIETDYNGYRFRSRLEARWAVFFDALHVPYEYEPEGFDLGNGLYYLPDFRVKCYGKRGDYGSDPFNLYIEVKGQMTIEDVKKIETFAGVWGKEEDFVVPENPILIVNSIPSFGGSHNSDVTESYRRMDGFLIYPFNYELIDGDHFAAYPAAHNGRFYLWGDDSSYINKEDVDNVERAYDAARKARFEHGEKPIFF